MKVRVPSKYLKADDLQGKRVRVTCGDVTMEDVGGEDKYILHFKDKEKGMVLNATNIGRLTIGFGSDDSEEWYGKELILQSEPVQFQGRTVQGLRVQIEQAVVEDDDGDPPF